MTQLQKQQTLRGFDHAIELLKEMRNREEKSDDGIMRIILTQNRDIYRTSSLYDTCNKREKRTQVEENTLIQIQDFTHKKIGARK